MALTISFLLSRSFFFRDFFFVAFKFVSLSPFAAPPRTLKLIKICIFHDIYIGLRYSSGQRHVALFNELPGDVGRGGGFSGSIFTYVLRFASAITPCTFATRAVHGPRWVKNATQTNDGAIAFCVRGSSFFVPSSVVHFPHSQHSSTLNTLRLANADSFVLLMGLRGCPVRAVDVSKGRRCKGVYYTRNPWLLVDLQ